MAHMNAEVPRDVEAPSAVSHDKRICSFAVGSEMPKQRASVDFKVRGEWHRDDFAACCSLHKRDWQFANRPHWFIPGKQAAAILTSPDCSTVIYPPSLRLREPRALPHRARR